MQNIVFLNGKFLPDSRARIPISTHALHYGTGCFEGIRGYWNDQKEKLFVFKMKDHYDRLSRSCQTLHMKLPMSVNKLCKITIELLRQNHYRTGAYIRPLVYKSDEVITKFDLDKLTDGFAIYTTPLGHYLNVSGGIKVTTTGWERVQANMIPPSAKPTGLYMNTCLAKTEAGEKGFDEAVLLNTDGSVSEGSAENIFLVKNGKIVTPSLDQNILEGVTRNTIIELAKEELNISTIQRRIPAKELATADEVFLTGTGAEVTPVIQVNKNKIGDGGVGKITAQLQKLYFEIVHGKNPKYARWITET